MRDDGCFTIKLYYNGIMRHNPKQYIGGDVEYFDFVDIDKLGMPEFWGFAEGVGYSVRGSVRYWHKYGKTMDKGKYQEHDNVVLAINKHIPSNYEVAIYLEHLDSRGIFESQTESSGVVNSKTDEEDSDFYDSEYDFEEDDKLFDVYVDLDIELMGSKDKGKSVLEKMRKTFVKKFNSNPKLGTSEFRDEICTTLKANVSRSQAYREKRKALKIIEEDEEGIRFHRLYICFSACKDIFKAACRPVVGVDGCFLKGQKGGQLLSTVEIDPNNNIFPICFALVEGKTKDTWMWFLNLLDSDLGISENQYRWTFMSDKQKVLIPAFESLFPDAENRFCVRHLHTNMKKDGSGGMAVKNALWAAARASRIEEFGRRLEELKAIDELAFSWLVKKPPNQWSRSHFSPFPKCDILLNNMCECFNSFIIDAREKPTIPMLETIKTLLMIRLQLNREKAEKWDSAICPNIRTLLIENKKNVGECIPIRADEWNFQIVWPFDQYTVNVKDMSCSFNPQTAAVQVATLSASSSGGNQETTQTREKLQVRKPSKKGVNIKGTSNRIASININQGPTIHTPMLIRGSKNFITLTNLRAFFGNQSNSTPHYGNPSLKPQTHPNMVSQPSNVASSQSRSVSKPANVAPSASRPAPKCSKTRQSQSTSKSVSMSGKSASQPAQSIHHKFPQSLSHSPLEVLCPRSFGDLNW
ncbi:hypothetical protein BUALT_Bualt02G0113900 [Buddleja alternifolia]|uniref:MULE transposase domain-containing protein n=1 Tax=Buddleja alternifolia TaxID=168488 RepID=A0AAV6XZF6_9LAMI|nr:hypothetical protein BUALT_Bualt02G0113900 [Buddleja alternifolia]